MMICKVVKYFLKGTTMLYKKEEHKIDNVFNIPKKH